MYNQQPQLDVIRCRFKSREQEKYKNRMPLNLLIKQNPDPYQVTYYKLSFNPLQ